MANMDRLRFLLEAQARGYTLVAALLIRQLRTLWGDFDEWYDGDLVAARAARSATLVQSAQGSVRTQTLSYMKFVYQQFDDLQFPTDEELDRANDELLDRLVNPLDEWNRPAEQFRYARSQESSVEEAIDIALQRVEDLADVDMELTMRKSANNIFKATPKITGYRRVLHPELAESGTSCGLCIAASTRVYSKEELLPIHEHCHCGVMPIVGDEDPGDIFNQEDIEILNQVYEAAGGNTAQALSRTRFKIVQHGELGPYLAEEGSKGTGRITPSQTKISRSDSVAAQIQSLNESLSRLLARQRAGEDVSEAIVWQQERLRILNQESQAETRRRRRR